MTHRVTALLTGATGFIGTELAEHIVAAGIPLRATSATGGSVASTVAVKPIALSDSDAFAALCEGVDTVFHLAGIAHQRAAEQDYRLINTDAAVALMKAAIDAGVSTFVFLSSSRADQPLPGVDPYALSKREAEQRLTALAEASSIRLIIVRPALVYGPGVKGNLALLARAIQRGCPLPPEQGARSMIDRSELCRCLLALSVGEAGGKVQVLTLADSQTYSTRRIMQALRKAAGKGAGVTLPLWCWRLGARALDLLTGASSGTSAFRLFGNDTVTCSSLAFANIPMPSTQFEDAAGDILAASGPGSA